MNECGVCFPSKVQKQASLVSKEALDVVTEYPEIPHIEQYVKNSAETSK
jgi:hypothetical protein